MAPMRRLFAAKLFWWGAAACVAVLGILFSLPSFLTLTVEFERQRAFSSMQEEFPVTVNPHEKTITENPVVDAYLESAHSPLQAAAATVGGVLMSVFTSLAVAIADSPWYESLAASDGRYVQLTAGMRKEQVASAFASALGWNTGEKKEFLIASPYASLPLPEGSFSPGIYLVTKGTTPRMAQALVNDRFSEEVLAHYSTTTAQIVPLNQALTIASLIEREAAGAEDMRLISGIIWNRLFIGMNLQIDATLQYARANAATTGSWWPAARPQDRFRKSPYNTYLNKGLPPTPIANPSVAAVLAALNPKLTSCLFYFHDALGQFHCSDTYAGHVALLKQYYGRGK